MAYVRAPQGRGRRLLQRQQSGFTMAELLVTMLLLTVILLGLATLQAQTIRHTRFNSSGAQALRLTQSVIEQYQTMRFGQLPASDPNWWVQPRRNGAAGGMTGVSVDGESAGPFTVQFKAETFQGGGRLITVETAWVDNDPRQGITVGRYTSPVQRVSLTILRFTE